MKYLFDSRGQHVANFINNQLYATTGKNIGHYLPSQSIFIDMSGRYLGEIVNDNRLMANTQSPYRGLNFGVYGNYGNIGNYGNPGNYGSIGVMGGYKNINSDRLK